VYGRSGRSFWESHERNIVHELGHLIDNAFGNTLRSRIPTILIRPTKVVNGEIRIDHGREGDYFGYAGGTWTWQFGYILRSLGAEEWADMFVGWVYGNNFNTNPVSLGHQRILFMSSTMTQIFGGSSGW
jgi:hypothetical protein